ncbi:MAG: hypothetical protein FJ293_10980, partial [Planctomycetes bacterium]|nr:hypothetical protein [Planctomycetota bacterium]
MGGFAELLFAVIGGGGAPAPELQVEIPLESGARVVMIGGATEDAGRIGVAVAVPVGWADAGGVEGAITAQLAARFAVTPKDGASSFAPEVLPTVTLYCGTLAADSVEAELAELAERLIARECDLALFDAIDDGIRRPPPASAFDRLREATAPGCAEGGGPFGRRPRVAPDLGATAATEAAKARMLEFLAARVGSEGCVIALVGAAPSGEVALAAARAFECLPRARGVAPPAPREAALQAPR